MKTIEAASTVKRIYRLPTQEKRAAFVRKEMRRLGMTVEDLASSAEVCWQTAAKFAALHSSGSSCAPVRDPRTDTTRKIFRALGYDLCVTSKESKGIIEL